MARKDMTTMTISVPIKWKDEITFRAELEHKSASQWMRDLLEKELIKKKKEEE